MSIIADLFSFNAYLQLYTAKSRTPWSRTDNLFNRLIINAIQTGSITVICAGVDLALFVAFTSNNYHYVPAYILAKLYVLLPLLPAILRTFLTFFSSLPDTPTVYWQHL